MNGLEITHSAFRSIGFDTEDNVLYEADFSETEGQLFKETFGPNALDSYTIVDTGTVSGPSNWSVIGTEIVDTSNINGGSTTEAEGTVAVTGDGTWENVRLRATVRSTDDDSIGVVLRYQDESNYVRYSIDQQRSYRRIMEVVDGVYTTIWEDDEAYVSGTDYEIDIRVYDTRIVVFHGELFVAAAELSQSSAGQAGLYAYMNNGSYFSAFQVDSLHSDPLLWRADFPSDEIRYQDASGYTVGPSDWKIENDFLVNRANVAAGSTPEAFGTFSYLGNQSFGDARITARVRSEDDDSIGIMFRMQTDNESAENPDWNYYRFSIDKQRTFHRLVKVIDGTVTTLWEDVAGTYTEGQTYEMGVSCIDDQIELYLDGVLLATVEDSDMLEGQIAAYCYYHDHAVFEEVVVTDNVHRVGAYEIISQGASYGPTDWTTYRGVFRERSNIGTNSGPLYKGAMAILENETYDDLTLKANVRSDDDDAVGLVFRYQDPRNYYRFSIDRSRSYQRLVKVIDGVATTLAEVLDGYDEGVTYELKVAAYGDTIRAFIDGDEILKVEDSDLSQGRIGLYAFMNDATEFSSLTVAKPSTDAYLLFSDEFDDVALPGWTVVDQGPGGSQWKASSGKLTQTKDIGAAVGARTDAEKLGTLISAGDAWTDCVFTAMVQSADDDEIGLLFRYTDEDNHYRFTMDKQGGFRRLIDVSGGVHTVLWEDDFAYEQDTAYDLKVVLDGNAIEVYTNGLLTLHLKDSSHGSGQIGFHTWANDDASFSQVRVYDLALIQDESDFDEDFSNPFEGVYKVVDDGTSGLSSNWTNSGSFIRQGSNYAGSPFSGSDPDKPGTYAATYESFSGDHRVEVALTTTDNDALGLMFRYQDNDNYYRLSMDMQKGYRRLIRKDSSGVTVLWEDLTAGFDRTWGQVLAVDCVGDVITGYLNGVELFQVEDDTFSEGGIALYTWGCTNVRFHRVRVLPAFQATWYRFADEPLYPDGTVFRIFSGPAEELPSELPTVEVRHVAEAGEAGRVHFLGNQLSLDALDADGESVHAREFLRKSMYSSVGFEVLRKRDGTGAVLFPTASNFAEGTYLLRLTFRRDNTATDSDSQVLSQWADTSDEVVELVLPWELLETE